MGKQETEKDRLFVGEFEEWHEAHFEITRGICANPKWANVIQKQRGDRALRDYARRLTDDFMNKKRSISEMDKFLDVQHLLFYTTFQKKQV